VCFSLKKVEKMTEQIPEPELTPGSPGTEGVWSDIDRSYDVEFRHRRRAQLSLAREVTMAAQVFQAQALGIALLGEAEQPLVDVAAPPQP
jgi:hypothetical protein